MSLDCLKTNKREAVQTLSQKRKEKKKKKEEEEAKSSLKITNPNAHYIIKSISGLFSSTLTSLSSSFFIIIIIIYYQVLLLTSLFKNNLFCLSSTHLLNKKKYKV